MPLPSERPSRLANLNLTSDLKPVVNFEPYGCPAVTGIGCAEPGRLLAALFAPLYGIGTREYESPILCGGSEGVAISVLAFLSLYAACPYSHA